MKQADLQEEAATEPRVDLLEEPGLTADIIHPTSHDLQEVKAPKRALKTKKKGTKARSITEQPPCFILKDSSPTTTSLTKNFLTTHAKVYAVAAKYNIPPLTNAALEKFKSGSEGNWEHRDLITAIPVVYGQATEIDTEIRDALRALILENAHELVSEAHFREAIEEVDGLPYDLFRTAELSCALWETLQAMRVYFREQVRI